MQFALDPALGRTLGVGLAAALLTTAAIALARRLPRSGRFLDLPGEPLRVHTRPVPRLGGVGIFAALGILIPALGADGGPSLLRAIVPCTALFLLGFADDALHLPAWPRLVVQLAAGVTAGLLGFRFTALPAPLDVAAAAVVLVACANALNWLDGVDGLAGGVAAIAATMLAVAFHAQGLGAWRDLHVALGSALLAFLAHNVSNGPRKVFLGDAGSMTCGMLLGLSAATLGNVTAAPRPWLAPWLVLAVPLGELAITVVRRTVQRRSPLRGDRGHLYDRLLGLGVRPRQVLLLHWCAGFAGGIAALVLLEV